MNRNHKPTTRKRVAIIGAGPGGLAAAMLLAKAGLKVTIFERNRQVGGRTSTMHLDGFQFDTGPTFFLYPRVLREIFAAVGYDLDTEVPMTRLDPQYRISFGGGGRIDATHKIEEMEREIARISPHDADSFQGFLAENRRKLAAFRPCLESSFSRWTDLLRGSLIKAAPLLRPWASVDSDLRRHFSDPRIRLAFSFQSKYLGMSPFRCPSLFTILSFLEYEYGVFHPTGGCGAVTAAMGRIARELGVDIRLQEPVQNLEFNGRRVVGVHTPGGHFPTDLTLINADFARAMERLVPDKIRRRWKSRKIKKKRFSCSTFMLYLGIRGRYDHVPHHTIHVAKDYEKNLREIETDHVLSDDPSFYVQNACITDPTLAPPGHSTLYVLVPVTHQHPNVDWRREAPAFRERILKYLEHIGIHQVEKRIVVEKSTTPEEWDKRHEIHLGATFNLAHNFSQMLYLRPRNRFEDLQGVYLAGGGTHPGSGLPVIFESARISTRLLLQDLGLNTSWLESKNPLPLEQPVHGGA